jgi:uncharacterized membrane protein YdjX (TVP38/TMEM64 family)
MAEPLAPADALTDPPADPALAPATPAERACASPRTWIKPVALVILVGAVVAAVPATPLGRYLAYDEFRALVVSAGLWGPLLFLSVFTVGAIFVAPASLIAFAGAAVFDTPLALLLIVIGVNLGASVAFGVGRWAGRDLVEARLSRMRGFARVDRALVRNGFFTILLLRLVFAPYNLLNYLAAFTHLRYRDFAVGTFVGMLPVAFVWVFMGNVLGQVWQTGDLRPLWSPRSLVAAAVFLVCVGVPLAVRWRRRQGSTSPPPP